MQWSSPKQVVRSDDAGEERAGCAVSITFEFTAVDACNNTVTIEATFTIVDTAPPRITTFPVSLMLAEGANETAALRSWLDNHGGGMAEDTAAVAGINHTHTYILSLSQSQSQPQSLSLSLSLSFNLNLSFPISGLQLIFLLVMC